MHEKQELEAYSNQQVYSTYISEEYEYSHEKAERVSLPHKNARIHLFKTQLNKNKNTQTLQVKHLRCDWIKI